MRGIVFVVIFVLLFSGAAYSYSAGDFFEDIGGAFAKFFSLTGFVVLDVAKDIADGGGSEDISIPEPPSVEAKEEEPVEEPEITTEEEPEVQPVVQDQTPSSSGSSSSSEIGAPSCSDYEDNNVNYLKKGVCKDDEAPHEDYCSEDGISVMEFSCGPRDSCVGSWYVCPDGCIDGACVTGQVVELEPDLKVLSIGNYEEELILTVKNVGTKGTFFKTKFVGGGEEIVSDVDYYLDSAEIVEVKLGNEFVGNYFVEVISEDDSDLSDNGRSGVLMPEEDEGEITGGAITEVEDSARQSSFFEKILEFFRSIFG